MRRFAASMVGSGGLIAAMAFFMPWVGLSCSGEVITTVSPYERATGFDAADQEILNDPRASQVEGLDSVAAEPVFWMLLVIPGILAVIGLIGFAPGPTGSTQLIAGGTIGSLLGLLITVLRGMRDKLGLVLNYQLGPDVELVTSTETGAWIAVAGYALALAGALIAWIDRMANNKRPS
jgi:hypothetical protein